MDIYYVYAYLREKDNTPYYIGKGKNKRAYSKDHSVSLPKDKSKIIFYHTNLTENDARKLERHYIKLYGRKDLGTGILYNQTDGGDGGDTSKSKAYLEAKAANKFSNKGMKNSPEQNKKIADALRGRKRPPEVVQKMSQTRKARKIPSSRRDLKTYTFLHPEHGTFIGTRYEFNQKFGEGKHITNDMLAGNPRSRKGWIVIEKWIEVGLLDSFSERFTSLTKNGY